MRVIAQCAGASLIEQLLALLLGAVIVTSLYGFFRAQLYHFIGQQRKTATLEDARGALDIIARDLKNAGSWASGSVPAEAGEGDDPDGDADAVCNRIYAASPILIHVQMDLNGNGTCADRDPNENLRYELTPATATCPGIRIIRRNGDCLVANVTSIPTDKLFTFFDEAGTDLGNTPAVAAIYRVRIAFSVRDKAAHPTLGQSIESTVATSVQLRN